MPVNVLISGCVPFFMPFTRKLPSVLFTRMYVIDYIVWVPTTKDYRPFLCRHNDYVTALAGGKTKAKLEAAHSNQHRFGYTRSLKYNLVVMLGARINRVQTPIWNFIAYLLPLPDKKPTTAVVKRDKMSGLDRNDCQKCLRLQRTLLIRKG